MANFQNTVVTLKGQALMAKMIAGVGSIQFTKISTSSQQYTQAQLEALTSLANVKQTTLVSKVTRTNGTAIKIEGAIDNTLVTTGYYCYTVGVYALDPNDGEILYAVTITSQADYIPAFNNLTTTGVKFEIVTTVGNSSNVSLQVDPAAVATVGDLDEIYSQISNLQSYVGYTDDDIFGIEADFKNNKFTRLAGAANKTPGAMFDGIECFGGRKRCIVANDGVILAYHGEAGYTETGKTTVEITKGTVYPIGTAVQVMVYQPKFYYKVVPLVLDKITDGIGYHMRKARYYVSAKPKNGFRVHPAFIKNKTERPYVLIGAFEGCLYDTSANIYINNDEQIADFANDMLSSIANVKPISGLTHNLTRRNCGLLAEKRGEGWSQTYAAIASATQLLLAIEYGTFNSQNAIGKGVVDKASGTGNESELTGQTTLLGNASGMASGTNGLVSISYRGEENPWGNIWKFVDGINVWGNGSMRGGVAWIADNAFVESKRTDNYQSTGFTFTNASGYISAMGYGNPEFDWLFFASETSGNSTLPVGDYNYVTANLNGDRIAILGGDWYYALYAGVFCWSVYYTVSHRYRTFGGRLVYVPNAVA